MNSPARLGVFPATATPTGFYSLRFWGFSFPRWNLGSLSCSSWLICVWMRDCRVCQLLPCRKSYPPQLPVSTPLTRPGECFFNSLVLGLPNSLISWQFWLVFVFNLLLSFFWLCEEEKCVPTHASILASSQSFLLFRDLDTFEEYWSGIL